MLNWEVIRWGERTLCLTMNLSRNVKNLPVDCMIASIAVEHDIRLLHNDRDFDHIAEHSKLRIYGSTRQRIVLKIPAPN